MNEQEEIKILNEEQTKDFLIGKPTWPDKKKKKLSLYMLSINSYFVEFVPRFVTLLNHFKNQTEILSLPSGKDWKNLKKVDKARSIIQQVFSHKKVRSDFIDLVEKVGYLEMKRSFFEKWVDPGQLIGIFLYAYKYNIDDLKKKVRNALRETMDSSQQLPISIDESLKKGGLKKRLKPRYPLSKKSKSH